ncbi:MAG TPA: tetratricopeptide repeat protein, partial [Flavitalea sp.]|nr:tetratricopeptide repeat protein [Flavitalea sp.]
MINIDILLERAKVLLDQGRNKDAQQQLQQVLQNDPQNDFALSLMGRCLYNQKKYDEGMNFIKHAITIRADEDYYFYLLAFGHYYKDQNLVAQRMLDKAIQLNPYVADYFGLSALIFIEEVELKNALKKANEGLEIDPENITCLNARATALNKLKQTDAAVETMQTALKQNPENEFTHTTIGWNFLEKGRHKDAAAHFREALRIHPNLEGAQTGLKQALKSRIAPYRWLLQYSFWISNKGKNLQWILPLALFALVRLLIAVLGEKNNFSIAVVAIVGFYLLFVITSWVINPVANFTLLFNKDGKYALTNSEKWSAITSVGALVFGALMLIVSYLLTSAEALSGSSFIPGLVCLSLALPLSNMQFPITFRT